ncbi:MAG: C40 family peptidase [Magnetococcales bacterium]|nr:C40 family peptidase [Magnetococcales bacterium]MBF0438300.1 C40 family peptidase [Magnetococcales bacterium]
MTDHWAIEYLGAPWVSGASGPESYDCWGLVRAVYRDRFGIKLPIVEVKEKIPSAVRHDWRETKTPEDGDGVIMSTGTSPHHVGLFVVTPDGNYVLHSVEGAGVVLQSMSALKIHSWNICGYYTRIGTQR